MCVCVVGESLRVVFRNFLSANRNWQAILNTDLLALVSSLNSPWPFSVGSSGWLIIHQTLEIFLPPVKPFQLASAVRANFAQPEASMGRGEGRGGLRGKFRSRIHQDHRPSKRCVGMCTANVFKISQTMAMMVSRGLRNRVPFEPALWQWAGEGGAGMKAFHEKQIYFL